MPWAIPIAAAAVSAAGSIAGGKMASKNKGGGKSINTAQLPMVSYNPAANPASNASTLGILQLLGQPTAGIAAQASPFAQVGNIANQSGALTREEASATAGALQAAQTFANDPRYSDPNVAYKALQDLLATWGPWGQTALVGFNKAVAAAGLSPTDLFKNQVDYNAQQKDIQAQAAALAPTIQSGITGAETNIAGLQSAPSLYQSYLDQLNSMPTYTAADINRYADIERKRATDAALQAANVGGYNPAQSIAYLNESTQPTANAIAILQGIQGLGTQNLKNIAAGTSLRQQDLASLLASITAPLELGTNQGAATSQAAYQSGSIASQQIAALLGGQTAQAQLQNDANISQGNGITGALSQLAGGANTALLLQMLTQKQPGTSSIGGNSAGSAYSSGGTLTG